MELVYSSIIAGIATIVSAIISTRSVKKSIEDNRGYKIYSY